MGLLAIAGAAALVLIAGGESRLIPTEPSLSVGAMKDACAARAAEAFDTNPGLISFADDADAVREADGGYRLDGVVDTDEVAFQCVFDARGRFDSVAALASPDA